MPKVRTAVWSALALVFVLALPASAKIPFTAAGEYRRTAAERLVGGVHRVVYARSGPTEAVVNVAHVGPRARVALRSVTSNDALAGPGPLLERTSSMCARVGCIAAINGDFFREGIPVGAVASGGVLYRTPNRSHHELVIGPHRRLSAGQMRWSGKLVTTDLRTLRLDGVNVARGRGDLVLYTRAFGPATGTNRFGNELLVRFRRPRHAPPLGQTAVVRLLRLRSHEGNARIPRRGAVLSGHGSAARALADTWSHVRHRTAGPQALLRFETPEPALEAIGGTPILVRDGRRWFANEPNDFVRGRHPRTIVGWNRRGDVWLVAVDGRQPGHSMGFTLAEAADFMIRLGATEAINLDGGGSTTFAVRGEVVNRPSDRLVSTDGHSSIVRAVAGDADAINVERPVANALVLVPRGARRRALGPPGLGALGIPRVETIALPAPVESDPASNPDPTRPALLGAPEPPQTDRRVPVALAALLLGGAAWGTSRRRATVARP